MFLFWTELYVRWFNEYYTTLFIQAHHEHKNNHINKTTWLNLPQSDILLYWTVKNPDLINGIRENFFVEIRINKINIYDTGPGRQEWNA